MNPKNSTKTLNRNNIFMKFKLRIPDFDAYVSPESPAFSMIFMISTTSTAKNLPLSMISPSRLESPESSVPLTARLLKSLLVYLDVWA